MKIHIARSYASDLLRKIEPDYNHDPLMGVGAAQIIESDLFPFEQQCRFCKGSGEGNQSTYCRHCGGAGITRTIGMAIEPGRSLYFDKPLADRTTVLTEKVKTKAFAPHWPTAVKVPLRRLDNPS